MAAVPDRELPAAAFLQDLLGFLQHKMLAQQYEEVAGRISSCGAKRATGQDLRCWDADTVPLRGAGIRAQRGCSGCRPRC